MIKNKQYKYSLQSRMYTIYKSIISKCGYFNIFKQSKTKNNVGYKLYFLYFYLILWVNLYCIVFQTSINFYIFLIPKYKMSSKSVLPVLKTPIQQKAIQKFPFALNNKTYFSTQCYYEDTIINGISLEVKQAKGISDSEHAVSYLNFSNRLIFYAGANILSYNMYKQKYEIIYHSQNLLCLEAFSLTADEKEYVVWVEKVQRNTQDMMIQGQKRKSFYQICVYDFTRNQKIYSQKLLTINKDLKPENVQILTFMHPQKVLGVAIYNPKTNQTQIIYKKASSEQQFGDQCQLNFPFQLKYLKYDLQSNSYFFLRNEDQVWALRSTLYIEYDSEKQNARDRDTQSDLVVEKILSLSTKKTSQRKIIHFSISEAFLIILTCKNNQERELQFYSLFSYGLIFTQSIWRPEDGYEIKMQNQKNSTFNYLNPDHTYTLSQQESMSTTPIDFIQFNKNIIIGTRNNSTQISIYSLHGQNLRHIRNTLLDLENCFKIERLFINPFSSEVMILSRHYQLQSNTHPRYLSQSQLAITKSEKIYRKFFLQISSFFITMQASVISVQKMSLQKKNYCQILTLPWLSQFLIQTDNSFKNKRWQQKFDLSVRCSAVHPTGQYVALGFNDCFKIYFLTHEGLVHTFVAQNIKQCTSLSYSKRGNDFAVATCYSIFIYDCYSYEKKHQIFLGMSYKIEQIAYVDGYQNDKVKLCLQCITTNKRIVTYNADRNYIQQFAFNPKSHVQESLILGIFDMMEKREKITDQGHLSFFQDQFKITVRNEQKKNITKDISNNKTNKKFGAIVYDQKTKVVIFTFGPKIYFISAQNFQSLGCFDFQEVSCIELSECLKTIFFGTVSGKIIAFPWPNKPINITSKIPTFWAHKTRIKKIKISSDLFDLISISEESMYIHSLVVVKEMRKVQKHQLQRQYNPQSMLSTNFYLKAGICLFSEDKYEEKCQMIKQNEEEAVNFNFILPEEREKQKIVMLSKLQTERQKITSCTRELNLPLKMEAVNLKQRVKNIQKELKQNEAAHENVVEKQIQLYQRRISQLNFEKDQLRKSHNYFMKLYEEERNNFELQLKRQRMNNDNAIDAKLKEASKITESANEEKKKHVNNFFELNEIEEEKKILNQKTLHEIETQISNMQQRNGFLMCKNIHLQKEIFTKRRKIQDVKELIGTTEQNINNLPRKNKLLNKPEDLKQQNQINKQFAEAEKKYLQETKKLIQKNKAINVSIELYQRQRQMMVILEKKLENQQQSINEIVKYISKQRENRKKIHSKLSYASQKANKISQQYETINGKRIRVKNILKEYLFNLTLYHEGVIDLEKLKSLSQINVEEMVKCPENIRLCIDEKKRRIGKIENSEQKILNLVKNERKIYSNQKRKTCMQNQDLLMNFNFLLHENKHLNNVLKDHKQKRKYCIKTISKRQNRKLTTKPTPFENYINFKTGRRTKTSPCAEYDLTR